MNALRIFLVIGLVVIGIIAFSAVFTVNERVQAMFLQFC